MRPFFAIVPAILVAGIASAQPVTTAPTTKPTTKPTSVPADPSTPKGALKTLSLAMARGDEQAMRALMHAQNEQERMVLDSQIAQSRAFANFRTAAVQHFGPSVANEITGDVERASADQLANVDGAEEKIDGDRASVTTSQQTFDLKKFGDGWKVVIGALLTDATPQIVDQILRDRKDQTQIVQETADEVVAGKYKTTDEVAEAFKAKMIRAQLQRAAEAAAAAATTEPATTEPDRK